MIKSREESKRKQIRYYIKQAESKPNKTHLKNLKLGNLFTLPMHCDLIINEDQIEVISFVSIFKNKFFQKIYELKTNSKGCYFPHLYDIENIKLKQRTLDQGLEFSFDISYPPKTPFVSSYTEIILFELDKRTREEIIGMFEN
ncbi:hypothetical protein [Aureibacter tunicatorum]|uniref:Uncharacterized protein n=1 Tax=Aureibacter tunicatorum TaxID=866807 RepID=A0AAE3XQX4_9BACT|nr:hypothetical protein [Aureibacter tunicatorum]MDR6241502.1 hypothetical protein [Aureibacter tunicatorum]